MSTPTVPAPTSSLEEIHSSVRIPRTWWRRFLAFSGPAFLVSVGYMDPGNWGTDLEAGSKFGMRLLWVLLMSNLMALLLQTLATRLGVITGRDLAQACRESYPRRTVVTLWILTEIAVAATDLAEVIGTIIALKLLFGLPYLLGLAVCAADTFLLLALQRRGVRLIELVTLALVGVMAVSFLIEIVMVRPDWSAVLTGFVPGLHPDTNIADDVIYLVKVLTGFVPALHPDIRREGLYVSIAMLGATVMPHNLYLHSALVQTRAFQQSADGKQLACKYNFFDSAVALNGAFFVNAAILILAATAFKQEVETLQEAHTLLKVLWGGLASGLFAVALLASGQSSTLTGTLAGQVVMEGFVQLRVRPWVRRLLTRSLAILPALLVLGFAGHLWKDEQADRRLLQLLVLSQAVLSFQLPFAIIPLVLFTSDRRRMGAFVNPVWLKILAWICAVLVIALNGTLIGMSLTEWGGAAEQNGWSPLWIYGTVGPLSLVLLGFLGWIGLYPTLVRREERERPVPAPALPDVEYRRIGVAVEFAPADAAVLRRAAALARADRADLILVHVVEGPVAAYYGAATDDRESRSDRRELAELIDHLRRGGLNARGVLGYGDPAAELRRLAEAEGMDLLVMGTHGHRFLADLALGQTVAPLLHQLAIPILVVPTAKRDPSAL